MATLIIHLTDSHVGHEAGDFAAVAEKIASAALSEIIKIDEIHIVLSGDMVQSGRASEYQAVSDFLGRLTSSIRQRRDVPTYIISCPGNHDCDFDGDQAVRDVVLKSTSRSSVDFSPAILAELAKPLHNYFEFEGGLSTKYVELTASAKLAEVGHEQRIRYVVFNSALFSQLQEKQGELRLICPTNEQVGGAGRTIFVIHHPLHWLAQDDSRRLASLAERNADLILLGHEHVNKASAVKDVHADQSATYLYGQLLRQHGAGFKGGGFQTIELNGSDESVVRDYRLGDSLYELTRTARVCSTARHGSFLDVEPDFFLSLCDAGANFTHRRKSSIHLGDIFVWPEIRAQVVLKESKASLLSGGAEDSFETLVEGFGDLPALIVIKGGEEYGKSALTKMLTRELLQKDYFPLLLDGKVVPSWGEGRIGKRIDLAIETAYGRASRDKFKQLSREKKVLLVDDFNLQDLARDGLGGFKALAENFSRIVLIVSAFPGMEVALNEFLRDESFVDSAVFGISQLSYAKRQELIERWLSAGLESQETTDEIGVTAARMARLVDETIGRNFIPSVPLFVLVILQRLELEHDLKTVVKSGAHGFLYEILINQAIVSHVAGGLDTVSNYLSRLAFKMFQSDTRLLSSSQLASFHADHCDEFDLDLPLRSFLNELVRAKILIDSGSGVSFKLPAHYYYFLAKELSRLDWPRLQPIVSDLVSAIHTEKAANVLLFLAHFSRSPEVAGLLLATAKATLSEYERFDIFDKGSQIARLSVPQIRGVLIDGSKAEMLLEAMSDRGLAEESHEQFEAAAQERLRAKLHDALAMNGAFKTLQVLGQLLRNSAGSLRKEQKREIASECANLGLRVLEFLHSVISENAGELLAFRGLQLREEFTRQKLDGTKYVTKNDDEIAEMLEAYLPSMFANLTMGALMRITNALGSEELLPTLSAVLSGSRTDEVVLLATKLEHFSDLDDAELKRFKREKIRDQDVLGYAVLRRFLMRRLMMFPVPREIKESIAKEFRLSTTSFRVSGAKRQALSKGTNR